MKRVLKSATEPQPLIDYKKRFEKTRQNLRWNQFKAQDARREPVKDQLRLDQRGLCAYCENTLIPEDESVEHFVPRYVDHGLELDWQNLLLACCGGEHPLPEEVIDRDIRHDPNDRQTCGHARRHSYAQIFNPLELPVAPRLFRIRSESGEITPDDALCQEAGVDPALAATTIGTLGLTAGRLNKARLAILKALTDLLAEDTYDTPPLSTQRERELAEEQIPAVGALPRFFTTIRFVLGQGAEEYLQGIGFQG